MVLIMSTVAFEDCLKSVPVCGDDVDYNGAVFVTTNEVNQQETIGKLSRNAVVGDTAIGVSGLFILNAIAARGSRAVSTQTITHAIVFDCSRRVDHFWAFSKDLLGRPGIQRADVFEGIVKHIFERRDYYWSKYSTELAQGYAVRLYREIQSGISFLSSDEQFSVIKKIVDAGNLVFKRIDMFNPRSFTVLSSSLLRTGHSVDMVYLSNVSEFAEAPSYRSGFCESVRQIVDRSTLVVYAESSRNGVFQKVQRRPLGCAICPEKSFSFQYTCLDPLSPLS
jgi:hypothetical protein